MQNMDLPITSENENWIKGTFALIYIFELVQYFVKDVFDEFYNTLMDKGSHFDDGSNVEWMSGYAKWNTVKMKWELTCEICAHCNQLFKLVLENHRRNDRSVGFDNCKEEAAPGSWGIAQLFMPTYCKHVTSPQDTDPYAILQIIRDCNLFKVRTVEKILWWRNKVIKSEQCTLTDSEKWELFGAIDECLKDAEHHCQVQTTRKKFATCKSEVLNLKFMTSQQCTEASKTALVYKRLVMIQDVENILDSESLNQDEIKKNVQQLKKLDIFELNLRMEREDTEYYQLLIRGRISKTGFIVALCRFAAGSFQEWFVSQIGLVMSWCRSRWRRSRHGGYYSHRYGELDP